jgi:hypothetical protein
MKKLLLLLCGISLLANVGLAWRAWGNRRNASVISAPPIASAPITTDAAPRLSPALFETADPTALRDQLRQAGVEERMIRAVLDGALRHAYQQKLGAERLEQLRHGWWKTKVSLGADDPKLLRESVSDPLRKLLGPDPLDRVDAEARYTFLPPEKRAKLAQIDQDYREMREQLAFPPGTATTQTRAEQEQLQLLSNERRKDVLAELTPEEGAELALRFSDTAHSVIARMDNIGATEAEYRFIKPAIDDFQRATKALPNGDEAGRATLEREIVRQFVEQFGYDRTVDIVWAGYNEYAGVARAARNTQLPENTVGRVMTLNAETGLQAAAIHRDATLTDDQKRAALVTLQQSARARLDTLLPAATQQLLEPSTFTWLSELGEGKYRVMAPGLMGYNGYMPMSLAQPPLPPSRTEMPLMPIRPR